MSSEREPQILWNEREFDGRKFNITTYPVINLLGQLGRLMPERPDIRASAAPLSRIPEPDQSLYVIWRYLFRGEPIFLMSGVGLNDQNLLEDGNKEWRFSRSWSWRTSPPLLVL
jgi:hypothetical protein